MKKDKKVIYYRYRVFDEIDSELFKKGKNGKMYVLNDYADWMDYDSETYSPRGDLVKTDLNSYLKILNKIIESKGESFYHDSNIIINFVKTLMKEEFYNEILDEK